jgi:hypothetical protein
VLTPTRGGYTPGAGHCHLLKVATFRANLQDVGAGYLNAAHAGPILRAGQNCKTVQRPRRLTARFSGRAITSRIPLAPTLRRYKYLGNGENSPCSLIVPNLTDMMFSSPGSYHRAWEKTFSSLACPSYPVDRGASGAIASLQCV